MRNLLRFLPALLLLFGLMAGGTGCTGTPTRAACAEAPSCGLAAINGSFRHRGDFAALAAWTPRRTDSQGWALLITLVGGASLTFGYGLLFMCSKQVVGRRHPGRARSSIAALGVALLAVAAMFPALSARAQTEPTQTLTKVYDSGDMSGLSLSALPTYDGSAVAGFDSTETLNASLITGGTSEYTVGTVGGVCGLRRTAVVSGHNPLLLKNSATAGYGRYKVILDFRIKGVTNSAWVGFADRAGADEHWVFHGALMGGGLNGWGHLMAYVAGSYGNLGQNNAGTFAAATPYGISYQETHSLYPYQGTMDNSTGTGGTAGPLLLNTTDYKDFDHTGAVGIDIYPDSDFPNDSVVTRVQIWADTASRNILDVTAYMASTYATASGGTGAPALSIASGPTYIGGHGVVRGQYYYWYHDRAAGKLLDDPIATPGLWISCGAGGLVTGSAGVIPGLSNWPVPLAAQGKPIAFACVVSDDYDATAQQGNNIAFTGNYSTGLAPVPAVPTFSANPTLFAHKDAGFLIGDSLTANQWTSYGILPLGLSSEVLSVIDPTITDPGSGSKQFWRLAVGHGGTSVSEHWDIATAASGAGQTQYLSGTGSFNGSLNNYAGADQALVDALAAGYRFRFVTIALGTNDAEGHNDDFSTSRANKLIAIENMVRARLGNSVPVFYLPVAFRPSGGGGLAQSRYRLDWDESFYDTTLAAAIAADTGHNHTNTHVIGAAENSDWLKFTVANQADFTDNLHPAPSTPSYLNYGAFQFKPIFDVLAPPPTSVLFRNRAGSRHPKVF